MFLGAMAHVCLDFIESGRHSWNQFPKLWDLCGCGGEEQPWGYTRRTDIPRSPKQLFCKNMAPSNVIAACTHIYNYMYIYIYTHMCICVCLRACMTTIHCPGHPQHPHTFWNLDTILRMPKPNVSSNIYRASLQDMLSSSYDVILLLRVTSDLYNIVRSTRRLCTSAPPKDYTKPRQS